MDVGQGSKPFGGLFGGQVALGFGQHFVTDHEFTNRGGTQKRGVEVGVQPPFGVFAAVEGCAVPAHRIGEAGLEQVVVAGGKLFEYLRQCATLTVVQVGDAADVAFGQQQGFKRPCGPVGDDGQPVVVFGHDAFAASASA